jgi:hypothetical protein
MSDIALPPPGIDPRVHYLTHYLRERGFTVTPPSNTTPYWDLTSPTGATERINERSKGDLVFRAILDALAEVFDWTPEDTWVAEMKSSFYRQSDRREKLRATTEGWSPEREAELIARAKEQYATCQITYTMELIDPDAAHEMLLRHHLAAKARGLEEADDLSLALMSEGKTFVRQRSLSDASVDKLARAMLRGEWVPTHQALALSVRDRFILDGQHRLWAILRSGIPCVLAVARNVLDEAFRAMDTGDNRTGATMLSMLGVPNPKRVVTALRAVYFYDAYTQDRSKWYSHTLSNDQIIHEFTRNYSDIVESTKVGHHVATSDFNALTAGPMSAAHYIITRANPEGPVREFFDSLRENEVDPFFDRLYPKREDKKVFPPRKLVGWSLTWDTRLVNKKRGKREKDIQYICQTIATWNALCQGKRWDTCQFQDRYGTPVPRVWGEL